MFKTYSLGSRTHDRADLVMEHGMKIDLSKLPKNTFINDAKAGWFYKHDTGIWCEVSAHCVDCEETVFEKDHTGERRFENPVATPAEEYFLDFTVLAVPPGFDLKDAQC